MSELLLCWAGYDYYKFNTFLGFAITVLLIGNYSVVIIVVSVHSFYSWARDMGPEFSKGKVYNQKEKKALVFFSSKAFLAKKHLRKVYMQKLCIHKHHYKKTDYI